MGTLLRSSLRSIPAVVGLLAMTGLAHSQTPLPFINEPVTIAPPGEDWTSYDWVVIGEGASGSVAIPAGAQVSFNQIDMGVLSDGFGQIEVNGAGAVLHGQNHPDYYRLNIGYHGTGDIFVTNGGLVQAREPYVAFDPASKGSIVVSGPDSRWEGLPDDEGGRLSLRIGHAGEGSLHVLDGATVEGHLNLFIGNINTTTGTFTQVGFGSGDLLIEGGSTVSTEGYVRFGNQLGAYGTGIVRGENSLLESGTYFVVGFDGDGDLLVEEGATVRIEQYFRTGRNFGASGEATITGPGTRLEVGSYMNIGTGGDGTLNILDGAHVVNGLVNPGNAGVSVPSGTGGGEENAVGRLLVSGEGSLLDASGFLIVGRGSGSPASTEVGSTGSLLVENGGLIRTGDYFRLGGNTPTYGEATVTGAGSAVEPGTYFQIGLNGTGSLLVTDGGRVEVPIDGGSFSSIGRNANGVGDVTIEGAGSFIQAPRLVMGSDTNLNPTGFGTMLIRDNGELIVGGHLGLRNGSTIELDNGTITLVGGVNPAWQDLIDVQGDGSRIFGTGTITGDILIADGGAITGAGTGIEINGVLSGGGTLENATVNGVRVTSATGPLTLNNVTLPENAIVHVEINDFSDPNNLIAYDSSTSLNGTHLEVSIALVIDDPDWSAQILPPGAAFASVTLPEGWVYDNGVLSIDGDEPPPPPPTLVSVYTGAAPDTDFWVEADNWDTDFFPDGPFELAEFSQPVDTDRINMPAASSLLSVSTVHQTAGVLVQEGFVANTPAADGNFLFRNSTSTPGFLRLHGFDTTINGEPATGLVVNFSDQNISFSTVNASFQIELARSGHFHVEKPDVQTRVIVGITELEGTSNGITKTGAGILHFGAQSANSDFSGGFVMEEGIVQWTNSGGASANPFGVGPLTLKGGALRSTTNTGRSINTSVVLDGEVTIGSLEDGFLGNITVNSASGSHTTTLASDSTLNMLSPSNWHQATTGDFGLTKAGPDTLVFTGLGGMVEHFGPTIVAEGLLRLNTAITSSPVTVESGASLGFGQASSTGQGIISAALTMEAGSNMVFRLEAPDAENFENHDSLTVTSALNVGGSELVIELGYTPEVNDTFLLIDNQAFTDVNGTFSYGGTPLTEGSRFNVFSNGFSQQFEITYAAGNGWSVAITAVDGTTSPFTAWAASFGLTGADAAPGANPAGDGYTNLEKFAFGIDPTVPVPALAETSRDGNNLILRWNERTDGSATYAVERSEDLVSWEAYTDVAPVVISSSSVPEGYERKELTVPTNGDRDFFRVASEVTP